MWPLYTALVLAGVILGHAVLRRAVPSGNSVIQFVILTALGAATLVLNLPNTGASRVESLAALTTLAFGCELYLFLFTFAISSVSLALLLEKADGVARTGAAATPNGRVQRLLETGLLVRTPAGYALTPRGQVIVSMRQGLRNFFRHES